jgi:phenylpyruvate tautomerase PptA (4-oxalocrotonate tautomerase family)
MRVTYCVYVMPILDVEFVGELPESVLDGLAQRMAEAAAEVMGAKPRGLWVKLRFLDSDTYAENGADAHLLEQPVFVSILQADLPPQQGLAHLAAQIAEALSGACQRPADSIHILFEPPARGRIAFGGQLRT